MLTLMVIVNCKFYFFVSIFFDVHFFFASKNHLLILYHLKYNDSFELLIKNIIINISMLHYIA